MNGGRPRFTAAIAANAYSYREWLAEVYGQVLAIGGHPEVVRRAVRHAKALARMTGLSLEDVVAAVAA